MKPGSQFLKPQYAKILTDATAGHQAFFRPWVFVQQNYINIFYIMEIANKNNLTFHPPS